MNLKYLLNESPTNQWRDRMLEYDDEIFTEHRLELCNKALNNFISRLEEIDQNRSDRDKQIMNGVKEVVIVFNELNEENEYFIETMEREELAEFIEKIAQTAGLEIETGFDITEQWREW